MTIYTRLHRWHQTKSGLLLFMAAELALSYGFASLSIDRGSLWYYLLTLVFLVGSLQNLFRFIHDVVVRSPRKAAR